MKKLTQPQLQKQNPYLRERYEDFVFESWDFKDQIFTCKCGHLDSGHCLGIGKCNYENCKECLEFRNCVVELKIIIYEKIGELNEYKGGIF